jgi:hypothetical protein
MLQMATRGGYTVPGRLRFQRIEPEKKKRRFPENPPLSLFLNF